MASTDGAMPAMAALQTQAGGGGSGSCSQDCEPARRATSRASVYCEKKPKTSRGNLLEGVQICPASVRLRVDLPGA